MPTDHARVISNRLLAGLPQKERQRLRRHCHSVWLSTGDTLCESNQPLQHPYFPLDAVVALVFNLGPYRPLGLGVIGSEGMLGATLALDIATAPCRAVVQSGGWALRISTRQLRLELNHCPHLRKTLKRYIYLLLTQLAQGAVCGHFHEVEPRLARWLLMTGDCTHAGSFYLTHAYLADMLGARRSGVTIAAGALQARGLIQYRRGQITILDHAGLRRAACGCYTAMRDSYARLFTDTTQS